MTRLNSISFILSLIVFVLFAFIGFTPTASASTGDNAPRLSHDRYGDNAPRLSPDRHGDGWHVHRNGCPCCS